MLRRDRGIAYGRHKNSGHSTTTLSENLPSYQSSEITNSKRQGVEITIEGLGLRQSIRGQREKGESVGSRDNETVYEGRSRTVNLQKSQSVPSRGRENQSHTNT